MGSARKRSLHEANGNAPEEPSLLHRVRNMWQFANLCQWIYIFGKAVKIDDRFDVEEIETDCLKPTSPGLQEIGLSLLKNVSSHRGLNLEIFDDYARRQFIAKDPDLNPFGNEEIPAKFAEFDVLKKIRVLQHMTQWIMRNPERIREKMEESKDTELASWRIEPMGWDEDDRTYFVLDDNRVYRLTDAPPPQPAPPKKKKSRSSRKSGRASKRRRTSTNNNEADDAEEPEEASGEAVAETEPQDDGLGGMKWECLAVTLDEVSNLIASFQKTKDANEKVLRDSLQEHLLPILEKQEESRKRKALQRERELLNLAKMANAKRSSRLANKQELQIQEEKAREEEAQRRAEAVAAKKAEQQRIKLEKERDARLMSREKRLKEREARRLQHEDELSNLSEDSKQAGSANERMSGRRLQAEMEKRKQALRELEEEEEDDEWTFDCICGVYGQIDDGTHSVACDRCNVWQHSKCLGVSEEEAERDEFSFICSTCKRREEEANKPRPTIKLKVSRPDSASSAPEPEAQEAPSASTSLVVEVASKQEGAPDTAASLPSEPAAEAISKSDPPSTNGGNRAVDNNRPRLGHSSSFQALPPTEMFSTTTAPAEPSPEKPLAPSGSSFGRPNPAPVTPGPNSSFHGFLNGQANGGSSQATHPVSSPERRSNVGSSPIAGAPSLLATPVINQDGKYADPAHPSTLPSSEAGHSPTKQSPAVARPESSSSRTSNFPAVFPPVETLAPSPQHPILTPPKKHSDPPRLQASEAFQPSQE